MRVLSTSREMTNRGHTVEILCFPESSLHNEAKAAGIKCITFPFKNGIHLNHILKLRKRIKSVRYDLIHAQFSRDLRFITPALTGISHHIPLVLTKRVGSFIKKKDFLHKWFYSRVDLITTISEVIRKNVIDTCPVQPEKVTVLYNGVRPEKYYRTGEQRIELRKNFGFTSDDIVIGLIARFSPGKGHEEFLKAAAGILRQKPGIKFRVIGKASHGEEEYHNKILELSKELGLNGRIDYLGFRKDIPGILAAMDILAVPSHNEAFGNIAIEGMAAGVAVAASGSDGLLDIIEHEKNGLQFPPKNPEKLKETLHRLIEDNELRNRLAEEGRKTVKEKFNEETQFDKLENLFIQLTNTSSVKGA